MRLGISLVFAFLLVGCSTPQIVTETTDKRDVLPDVIIEPIHLKTVEWLIRHNGTEFEYILDEKNNENLIHNFQEFDRYIKSSNAKIEYYRNSMRGN